MNGPNAPKEVKIEQNQSGEKSRKDPRALTGTETFFPARFTRLASCRKDPRALTGAETR
jgi:hypothetical protein